MASDNNASADDFDREEARLLQQQSVKNKKIGAVVVAALLVLGGGIAYSVTSASDAARAELEQSFAEFSTCLVGADAVTPEAVGPRLRNVQLAVMGIPFEKRASVTEAAWPKRCAKPAHELARVASGAGDEGKTLADTTSKFAAALDRHTAVSDDLSEAVTLVFTNAANLELTSGGGTGTPPPAAVAPLTQQTLARNQPFMREMLKLEHLRLQPIAGRELRFLIDDKRQTGVPALCDVDPDAKKIRCKSLPKHLSRFAPGLSLWGSTEEGAEPLVFAGGRGQAGIYRADDGKELARGLTYGSVVRKDGSLVRTIWNKDRDRLDYQVVPASGNVRTQGLLSHKQVGNPYYNSGLFWNNFFYKAMDDSRTIRLFTREISDDGALGERVDVGWIRQASRIESEDLPHIAACKMPEALVVRVKGWNEQYTAFYQDGKWTPPVPTEGTHGTLTCNNGTAVITKLTINARGDVFWPDVLQNRCNPAECQSYRLTFKDMLRDVQELAPVDKRHVTAAELDGKLMVLWGAGERGGLRMRVAPIEMIHKADDVIVYDDLVDQGQLRDASTLLETRLISGSDYAILFLSTSEGVFAQHVDGDGKLTPMVSEFE